MSERLLKKHPASHLLAIEALDFLHGTEENESSSTEMNQDMRARRTRQRQSRRSTQLPTCGEILAARMLENLRAQERQQINVALERVHLSMHTASTPP